MYIISPNFIGDINATIDFQELFKNCSRIVQVFQSPAENPSTPWRTISASRWEIPINF